MRRQLRLGVQQRQRPFNLRRPDEADRAARRPEALLVDELAERARDLEDRRAAAGVVVRPRPRVIEVATEDDLLARDGGIGAGDRGRGDVVEAGLHLRADDGMKANALSVREARLQRARVAEGDHEGEGLRGREGLEVAPADERLVLLRPRRALIRGVADQSRRAEFPHGQLLRRPRLRADEDDLPFHVLARVVALARPVAGVDQVRHDVGTHAVLRERDRHRVEAGPPHGGRAIRVELPQLREFGVPRRPRALRAVEDLPVRQQLLDVRVGVAVLLQLPDDQLTGLVELVRPAHAMQPRQPFEIALGRLPRQLPRQRAHLRVGEEGKRVGFGGECSEQDDDQDGFDAHAPIIRPRYLITTSTEGSFVTLSTAAP